MAPGKLSMVAMVVVMMSCMASTEAQNPPLELACVQSLIPCTNFLNSTEPPKECCDPLMAAFKTQMKCLCDAFKNTALMTTVNINITQVLQLPMHCGIEKADPTVCSKIPNSPSVTPKMAHAPEASSTTKAPPSLDKPAPPPGKGAATSITPISGLVLILIGFMFY